jgi:hypothetical protein
MNKTLTQELIEQKLEEKGWKLTHAENMTYDQMSEKVLDYYNVELTNRFDNKCQYYIYTESTRDGYEVWVAAEDVKNVCISEDVYYYDSDIHDALIDAIKDELSPIYVDDTEAEYISYAIEELYDYLYDIKLQETETELEDEGYEWPKVEA